MRKNRGIIRIFEALLAIIVVFSSLALATKPNIVPAEATYEKSLVGLGTNIILQLDSNGTLAGQIDNRNWTALSSILKNVVPSGLYFNLTVYDKSGNELNDKKITSGGSAGRNVYSVEVPIASRAATYNGYIVRLQLSRQT